ncbi:MAG: DUF342 domain-containing protein [Spirochaetales bacterium]|nr:DUF342 domain-containing protein [Spirochaetales bacterium]
MAAFLKGNLDLLIDPLEIEASLEFTVNENGQIWSREKIITLLKQKLIIDSVNPLELERAIHHFKQLTQGSHSIVIARGVAPQPPQHGTIKWQELPVPESLSKTVDSIVKKAPPPVVFDYKLTKIKSPKEAREKKAFGFFKIKNAKTKDYYVKEIKEKAVVSPEVKRIAYAEKASLIATIIDPVPGTAGKNIFGHPVPPPAAKKIKLFYGDGISQKDKQCFADVTGIIRIGSNWIDIIPYEATYYRVYPSEDGLDCFLDFSPGSGGMHDISGDEIYKKALELNFKETDLIPAVKISGIINQSQQYNKALKAYSLCLEIEPLIKLIVSEDKLKAVLSLRKGRGQGETLSLKAISTAITDAALKNLNLARIKQDILDFYKGSARELDDYVLIEGTPPAKGENGQLIWEVAFEDQEALLALKNQFAEQEAGVFSSLKEFPLSLVESIAKVKRDDKIALVRPPEIGYPGQDVYGKKIEGRPGKEVKYKLYENIKEYGHYILAGQEGFLEKGEKDGVVLLRIRPCVDAKVYVMLSDDKMQAFLSIIPPKGAGSHLSLEELLAFIEKQGVIHGLNEEIIRTCLEKSIKGAEVDNVLIASGTAPIHGIGERIHIRVLEATGKQVRIREDGRADYKQQDKITVVKKGDLLAEITPPREETSDGMDVLANPVPAKQKAGVSYTVGANARKELQPNGVIKIFAAVDGEFVFKKNVINVRELHLVKNNVGLETGNVKFPGSVYVIGSVQAGFSVISGENIVVENVVEEALISADGSIIIKKGVKGNGKAILRSKQNIHCLFAENAFILAVGELRIRNSLLHCNVKCNGRLILGKEKGTIMGGHIRVKYGMELINLGSISEVKTKISFGQDYLVGDQIELEEKEIKKLGDRVLDCDALMKTYKKGGGAYQEKLKTTREEKLQCLKLMEKHSQRLFLLREKFEEHYPSEVIVKGTVYPGVVIESHGRIYEVKEEKSMTAFVFNPRIGTIEIKPLT